MANIEEIGLSNPKLNQGRRMMLDMVNKLHSTGVQVDIDLPQIAVIGSQSAGKSSLIESISGITLPRAAGTCTRCPTECRLSRSDAPWQCIVSLRIVTNADRQPLGQARNDPFGLIIYQKSELEERIRRAQLAILNPTEPFQTFLNADIDDLTKTIRQAQHSFSSNAVTLQISGPDVADLSFCDLPGLIASVSTGGDPKDVALVHSLVSAYIKRPSCIILLTVSCETDLENQGAHGLAKSHDPEGKRTIGVLTKPDLIQAGEHERWLPFIRNEKEILVNNWYCVKQLASNELKENPTWANARKMENDFFATKAPWAELDLKYQKYLRTRNLVERLSSILSDLISKRLPEIQKELNKSIAKTRAMLGELPRAPSNDPRNEISALIHTFSRELERHTEGVANDKNSTGLIQKIRLEHEHFRSAIRSTAPNFVPFEKEAEKDSLPPPEFLQHEEGENESVQGEERRDDAIYIDEVLELAHGARTRELPGNTPFVVQKTLISNIIEQWQDTALALCVTIHTIVFEHVVNLVEKYFFAYGQGDLEHRVKTIIQHHMKQCLARAEERVRWLTELESPPFTLNTHYLAQYRTKFLAHYKGARYGKKHSDLTLAITSYEAIKRGSNNNRNEPPAIARILSALAEINISGVKPEDLAKLFPPDRMESALEIMADVRAYFQVAYKRFADNIPLAIDRELVRGATDDVLMILNESIGINSDKGAQICKNFSEESPQIAGRRTDLENKLARLETASGELLVIAI